VRPQTRRWLIGLAVVVVIGAPLLLASYLSLGLFVAPPWPTPAASSHLTPLVGDALWARARGGSATSLDPFNPINLAQLAFCMAQAENEGPGPLRDAAQADCQREYVPAFAAIEYVSELHMRAAGLKEPGFRKGHAKFVTTIWLARSWTKADLLATLVERGEYGLGFRGLEAAANGYFGRAVDQLTLPQAATLAAFVGGEGPDPWCDPASTASRRHRILVEMRNSHAFDQPTFEAADRSELALASAPAGHPPCDNRAPVLPRPGPDPAPLGR
jgi:hypothetical protein